MAEKLDSSIQVHGIDVLRDPDINKAQAFTIHERQTLGIHGLLPPRVFSEQEQVFSVLQNLKRFDNNLDRYIYLMGLMDTNVKLFYRIVTQEVELCMPIIYTPTVGLACQKYGLIFRRPKGVYITIHDKGHISSILSNWPVKTIKAIVVTDGERILGLGDLGAYGMGIPVGKLALYTALAGVNPTSCLPVLIDVGTNNEELLRDPLYIGLRQKRIRGQEYDALIEEFFQAVVARYGQQCLIQFEDFGNQNAFRLLEDYRHRFCTFNDDIQGTAAVAVAGVIAALRITGTKMSENTFLFQGAGEAAIGIADLLVSAIQKEGVSLNKARQRIWLVDSKGLVVKDRKAGGISEHKEPFAKKHKEISSLQVAIETLKPTAIIGASAQPGSFTKEILQLMGKNHKTPIIFALSNPTAKAECTAEAAYEATEGRCVFASGSPFPSTEINGKKKVPGQGNNAYIFPGIGLATVAVQIRRIDDDLFLRSAEELASFVTEDDLRVGRVYPALSRIREVSIEIGCRIAKYAYDRGCAGYYPKPDDIDKFVKDQVYNTNYDRVLPDVYPWPSETKFYCA